MYATVFHTSVPSVASREIVVTSHSATGLRIANISVEVVLVLIDLAVEVQLPDYRARTRPTSWLIKSWW